MIKQIFSNKKMIIIPLLVLAIISIGIFTISAQSKDPLQQEFDKKIQAWIDYCRSQPEIGLSSNPGTATQTEQYKAIENLGVEYLPYMVKYVEERPEYVCFFFNIRNIKKGKSIYEKLI